MQLEHAARGDISALMTDTARVADGLARGLNETAKFALDTVSGKCRGFDGFPGVGSLCVRRSRVVAQPIPVLHSSMPGVASVMAPAV